MKFGGYGSVSTGSFEHDHQSIFKGTKGDLFSDPSTKAHAAQQRVYAARLLRTVLFCFGFFCVLGVLIRNGIPQALLLKVLAQISGVRGDGGGGGGIAGGLSDRNMTST